MESRVSTLRYVERYATQMASVGWMCADWPVSPAEELDAERGAVTEWSENAGMPTKREAGAIGISMAMPVTKRWRAGRTLIVAFLGGSRWQRDAVRATAPEWMQYASLGLHFSADDDAQIRVGFEGGRSYSRVGTDAKVVKPDMPTMNLGWVDKDHSEEEIRSVILHEFGHALGCIHEHQSPRARIPWNVDAVYAYFAGSPNRWTRAEVDRNVFETYSRDHTRFSAFDPKSIMLYPIPASLVTDVRYEVHPNSQLSDSDRAFISRMYPARAEPTDIAIDGPTVAGRIGQRWEEDQYQFEVGEGGTFLIESHGQTNVALSLYGPDSRTRLVADDDDSGEERGARISTVLMSGQYLVRIRHQEDGIGNYSVSVKRP